MGIIKIKTSNNSSTNTTSNTKDKIKVSIKQKNKVRIRSNSKQVNQIQKYQKLSSSAFKRRNQKVDLISRMSPIGEGYDKKNNVNNNKNNVSENKKNIEKSEQGCEKIIREETHKKMKQFKNNQNQLPKTNIHKDVQKQNEFQQAEITQIERNDKNLNPYVQNHLTLEIRKHQENKTKIYNPVNKKVINKDYYKDLNTKLSENKYEFQYGSPSKKIKDQNSFNYYKIVGDYKRRANDRIRSYSNDSNSSHYRYKRPFRIVSSNQLSKKSQSRKSIQSIASQEFYEKQIESKSKSQRQSLKTRNQIMKQSIMNRRPQSVTLIKQTQNQLYKDAKDEKDIKDEKDFHLHRQQKLPLTYTIYSKKVQKLQNEVLKYKKLYFNSLSQMKKIELAQIQEKKKFELQRQVYRNQIQGLKKKIQAKKQYKKNENIGHLYTYNEYNTSQDVNKCMCSSKLITEEEKQSSLMLMTMTIKKSQAQENQGSNIIKNKNKKSCLNQLQEKNHSFSQYSNLKITVNSQNSVNPSSSLSSNLSVNSKILQQQDEINQKNIYSEQRKNSDVQKFNKGLSQLLPSTNTLWVKTKNSIHYQKNQNTLPSFQ